MARIRTIKPEFFKSRSLARCPRDARLTFAGLWTEADDHGHGIADERLLKAALYPLDDDIEPLHISAHLDVLAATSHIRLYKVAGEQYYEIVNWNDHQAAAYRRGEPRFPAPDQGEYVLHDDAREDVQESAACTNGRAGTRNEEQGTGSEESDPDVSDAARELCRLFVAEHCKPNGHGAPGKNSSANDRWLVEMDRLVRIGPPNVGEGVPVDEIAETIRWMAHDRGSGRFPGWSSVCESVPNFREKYRKIRGAFEADTRSNDDQHGLRVVGTEDVIPW